MDTRNTKLATLACELDQAGTALLTAFVANAESQQYAPCLAEWLRLVLVGLSKGVSGAAGAYPMLSLDLWAAIDIAGGLSVVTLWERHAMLNPTAAVFIAELHNAFVAETTDRLLPEVAR